MGLKDFILFRNLPAAKIDRASVAPLDLRAANAALHVSHTVGQPQWPKRDLSVYESEAYEKLALIFRLVNMTANGIAEASLRVYDPAEEEDPNHSLRQLINLPNRDMGEAMFWYNVAVRMCIYGYCVVEKERGGIGGSPTALWPLNSEWLKPVPRDNAPYDWEYTVPGRRPVLIEGTDVAVFRFADTGTGSPRGIGPIEVALREFGLMNKMSDFVKGFFDAGALPIYGLVLDPEADFTEEQAELIRAKWVERTSWRSGTPPAPPIMSAVKSIERLSFNMDELAYVPLRNVSEVAICQAFGIHPSMAAQMLGIEKSTYNNATEFRRAFYQDVIQKHWSRFDDVVTRDLLPEFEYRPDYSVKFDTSDITALQEDQTQRRSHALEAFRAGAITRAQYKRIAGEDVYDSTDHVYLIGFNVIEVPVNPNTAQGRSQRATAASVTVRALPSTVDSSTVDTERRSRGLVPLQTRAAIEQRAQRVYSNAARRFGPVFYAYFQDQKERVLSALSERSAADLIERRDVADVLAIDWAAEADDLDPLIRQLWDLMGETATGQTVELLGLGPDALTWDVSNPWVRDVMQQVAQRVTMVTDTTRQQIAQIVTDSLTEGTSIPELADKLKGLYEETYKSRSETIARTESMNAYSEASVRSYEESGSVSEVEFLDNPNHTTDPGSDGLTCSQRNGLVVPLERARFHIAGEHINGTMAVAPVIQLGVV